MTAPFGRFDVTARHVVCPLCWSQAKIWHWAVARLLLILWEHDQEIIRHAHNLTTDDEVRSLIITSSRATLNIPRINIRITIISIHITI